MKRIDWAQKLTSRKLWMAITALVTGVLILCNLPLEVVSQVATIVMTFGAIIAYILGESWIDMERVREFVMRGNANGSGD